MCMNSICEATKAAKAAKATRATRGMVFGSAAAGGCVM